MKKVLLIVLCLAGIAFGIDRKFVRPRFSTKGLVAHYKLWFSTMTAGKVFDYSLNGHTGTLNGTDIAPTYPGFSFNGTDDWIVAADHNDFSFGDSSTDFPFSVSVWVNMDDATNFSVVRKFGTGKKEWYLSTSASDFLIVDLWDENNGGHLSVRLTTSLTTYQGSWIFSVFTYSGNSSNTGMKIYLNGSLGNLSSATTGTYVSMKNTTVDLLIGRHDNEIYANGKIDDVRIYNRELSAIEVKSIYETTRWRYGR